MAISGNREKSGKVIFRKRHIKGYQDGKKRHVVVIADCCGTFGEGWNRFPATRPTMPEINGRGGFSMGGKGSYGLPEPRSRPLGHRAGTRPSTVNTVYAK